MSTVGPDELFLRGELQVGAARDALHYTHSNPNFEHKLTVFLTVNESLGGASSSGPDIYMSGPLVAQAKADIVMSLEVFGGLEPPTERTLAAQELLAIMVDQDPGPTARP